MENCKHLQFWLEKEDTDWATDDEENKGENHDDEEVEDDEDLIEMFTLDNTKEVGTKYNCNYCKDIKKLTFKKMKQHFIDVHKKEFEVYFGNEGIDFLKQ